jgi:hypothetical protein
MRNFSLSLLLATVGFAGACDSTPQERHLQWVARDAWDPTCASAATVEQWAVSDRAWREPGKHYGAHITATLKLVNPCTSTLPGARAYKQFESVKIDQVVDVVPCKNGTGDAGFALAGLEGQRCWTGPTLRP